jgi:hypothetical protein
MVHPSLAHDLHCFREDINCPDGKTVILEKKAVAAGPGSNIKDPAPAKIKSCLFEDGELGRFSKKSAHRKINVLTVVTMDSDLCFGIAVKIIKKGEAMWFPGVF